jgi:hypothetical protein
MLKANMKLYFRTLLASLKYLAYFLFSLACGRLMLEIFKDGILTFCVDFFVMFLISIGVRSHNEDVFDAYLTATGNQKLSLFQDLKLLVRSKYFYIELAAFLTYLVALIVYVGWILFTTLETAFTASIALVLFITVYLVLNTISWLIVHAIYRKKM